MKERTEEGEMLRGQRITRMKSVGRGRRREGEGQRRAVCRGLKKHCSNAMTATGTAGMMLLYNGKRFAGGIIHAFHAGATNPLPPPHS